jgi:hypothetical protein
VAMLNDRAGRREEAARHAARALELEPLFRLDPLRRLEPRTRVMLERMVRLGASGSPATPPVPDGS